MEPYSLGRNDGEAFWVFDSLDTIKASGEHTAGSFSVVEFLEFAGSGGPTSMP